MKKYFLILLVFLLAITSCKKSTDDISIKSKDTKVDSVISKDKTSEAESESDEKTRTENENISPRKSGGESKKEITTKEVNEYINKNVTVKGYVAEVVMRPKVNYLNFDKKYPDNTFTAVIFPDDMYKFEDLMKYQNKNVKVTGRISLYKGKPQIIINSVSQIKIIN